MIYLSWFFFALACYAHATHKPDDIWILGMAIFTALAANYDKKGTP